MTGSENKLPFPQFGPDSFTSPKALVHSLIAWDEVLEADKPHAVLVYDPEVREFIAYGPYPTAYRANEEAVRLETNLNSPSANDGPPVSVTIVRIVEP